ncbi:FAD-binding oxidoreductase [Mycobacterium koreense]|uniref:Amino acid dehydrogenase n=1 Tax=Mycolicibacillus koreensis TaxID=1069220 RepID=A0A7I7SCD6_9MYCO|nr:FAD-binding oxidoreductase [Mycolicibacillus koreensis]MCV7249070.1 FAD-binding oxidoreductase [Mycolicibacillus koreensis]OSC34121.1 amino acid dehydrogenase [Mycolicibacillus koreensis]BBY54584.1 D-amino-acid dehydrogenase [Mycolicibacillus koreensis]
MAGNAPRTAIVVGAGIVGLSTAWFLQERGVQVTVVDRAGVAAGSSWGNAGWISPALTIPLNEPSALRYGLTSLWDPTAPLRIALSADRRMWGFLLRFAAHCRWSAWRRAAQAAVGINAMILDSYDLLAAGGVDAPTTDGPITAVFETTEQATRFEAELRRFADTGQPVDATVLSGAELREQVPAASARVTAAVNVNGQRFFDPGRFVTALGNAVADRGGHLPIAEVTAVRSERGAAVVATRDGADLRADVAVIATGAWLSQLVGSRTRSPVHAGRGYSFTVPTDRPVPTPIYLPDARVACTPYRDKLRVAGTMEFRSADAPAVPARFDAIAAAAAPLLDGINWAQRTDLWVGPRPLTADGRPLIGELPERGIYVAGGHGMWGIAQGPATGRLLTDLITTGKLPAALRDFDPAR